MHTSRRRFLSQIGAVANFGLLMAIGRQLEAKVHGSTRNNDSRFVVLTHAAGWWARLLRPENSDQPAANWVLPEALSPLHERREQLLLVEDLYNPHSEFLHGNGGSFLSLRPAAGAGFNFGGITIDRAVARGIEAEVPFTSMNLGYPYGKGSSVFSKQANASADGPNSPYPALGDPNEIFSHYLGMSGSSDPAVVEARARQKSLLDGMLKDINRMKARLAGSEQAHMDQYLDGIRDLEVQLDALAGLDSCTFPSSDSIDFQVGQSIISEELTRFYYDSAAVALSCGLTNVVSIAHEGVGAQPGQPTYEFDPVNVDETLHNSIMHALNGLKNDDSQDKWDEREDTAAKLRRVYNWRSQVVADFLDKLDDLGVGDKTLTLMINQGGGQHHLGSSNIPVVLIGNPGGRMKTGRHLRFQEKEHSVSDAFVTAAQGLGLPMDSFGDPDICKGALPDIII